MIFAECRISFLHMLDDPPPLRISRTPLLKAIEMHFTRLALSSSALLTSKWTEVTISINAVVNRKIKTAQEWLDASTVWVHLTWVRKLKKRWSTDLETLFWWHHLTGRLLNRQLFWKLWIYTISNQSIYLTTSLDKSHIEIRDWIRLQIFPNYLIEKYFYYYSFAVKIGYRIGPQLNHNTSGSQTIVPFQNNNSKYSLCYIFVGLIFSI